MNFALSNLTNCLVHALDGDVGRVEQFYFDDLTWSIRYLTIRTKGGLPGHNVLIPATALLTPDWQNRVIPITLNMTQVFSCPSTEIEEPVSRQHEIDLHRYYEWPGYWDGSFYIPVGYSESNPRQISGLQKANPHLRAVRALVNARIEAKDGNVGDIQDIIADDKTWSIRYLIVKTKQWLPHNSILISPHWIQTVNWPDHRISIDLDQDAVMKSPKYDPDQPMTLDYEQKLQGHLQKQENKEWVKFIYHAPPKTKIYLAGTFNQWDPSSIKLGYHGKSTYSTMLLLPAGNYEYKYVVNGLWQNNPDCHDLVSNAFGSQNSRLVVKHMTDHMAHLHTFSRVPNCESTRLWSTAVGG